MISNLVSFLLLKIKLKGKCKFYFSSHIKYDSLFEGMNMVHRNAYFSGRLGYGSYIGNNCHLSADIGRFCSIAPHVCSNGGTHPISLPFATTAPCFYSLNPQKVQNGGTFAKRQMFSEKRKIDAQHRVDVKIGNDCWIGDGAFLVGGISIGDGAVVLAHSVVTKNVPDYAIVGGVPARIIKYRYDEATIAFLKEIQWWNNSVEWFKEHWELLTDVDKLKMYYKN
ncbi:MAG: CatB-related O-acetyltransferase [Prevotella sp.]|nr:CatB-related O-acetyltransferase [Prevotella sp.]